MRTQANIENIKKKSENKILQIKKENLSFFVKEISNIINKFQNIFEIAKKNKIETNSIIEGIKLTKKSLSNNIQRFHKNIKNDDIK